VSGSRKWAIDYVHNAVQQLLGRLTQSMVQAVCDFEPGEWYGTAEPTKRAAAHKGHMVRMGLVEHDGKAPVSHYRLTELGEAVRKAVLKRGRRL
jgi:hypothetical protein